MANYTTLKAAIQDVVKTNGNEEITGSLLQQSLLAMIDSLGVGFQFISVATPATNPGTPDQKVFYFAGPGTYPNFDNAIIPDQNVGFLYYNGTWHVSNIQTSPVSARSIADGIIQLYDGSDPVYPRTEAEAVFFDNNPTKTLAQEFDRLNTEVNGEQVETPINNIGTFVNEYFSGLAPYIAAAYLAGNINSLAVFPISEGKKYKLTIPVTPNGYKVWVFADSLPTNGEIAILSNSAYVDDTTGDDNPATLEIQSAPNNNYLLVCYKTSGGVPTLIEIDSTAGIVAKMGDLDELETEDKSSIVNAINEVLSTPIVTIDDTLTQEGEAADAKVVGDKFDEVDEEINGVDTETPITLIGTYEHEYFSGASPYAVSAYLESMGSSIVSFPIQQGKKYKLVVPNTMNGVKVAMYSDVLPIAGQQVILTNAIFYDDQWGDGQPRTIVIESAADYSYLLVCYKTSGGVPTLYEVETIGGVNAKIGNLANLKTANKTSIVNAINEIVEESLELALPDTIFATVGDKLQIFFRSIVKAINPYNYSILAICNKGKQFNRFYEYTPTTQDIGTTDFTIEVRNNNGGLLARKTCSLITVAAPSSPANQLNVICIGDSLTANGKWPEEACRRLIGSGGTPAGGGLSHISFCGNRGTGLARYCGYGGWTWNSYTTQGASYFRFMIPSFGTMEVGAVYSNNGYNYTVAEVNPDGDMLFSTSSLNNTPQASGTLTKVSGNGDATLTFTSATPEASNPLWDAQNNKMSFVPYANSYCNGQIDVVYVMLGWNGMTSAYQTDFESTKQRVKQFADCLHTEFPNAKMKLMGLQLPSQNGGCGSSYVPGTPYSDKYGLSVNIFNLNKMYLEVANDSDYNSFVEYIGITQQFDSENNYPVNVMLKNSRMVIKDFTSTLYPYIGDIVKYKNEFFICINQGVVGEWENVYGSYLPFNPYERYDWNAVHPSDAGYYQIADAIYRNIVARFCQ